MPLGRSHPAGFPAGRRCEDRELLESRRRVAARNVNAAPSLRRASRRGIHHQLRDKQLRASPTARLILHDDLDIASEQNQKSYETIQREAR